MQPTSLAAVVVLIAIAVTGIFIGYRKSVFRGVGIAVALTLLVPTWITLNILGIQTDYRVAIALAAAISVVVFRSRWLFDRLMVTDVIVAFLCVWQVLSEWNSTGRLLSSFIESYGFWVLPYVVGRCSARSADDLRFIAIVTSAACIVLGGACVLEIFTEIDLFQFFFGEKPGMLFHQGRSERWGFVRCEGPYSHPIFLGTVAMLALPWSAWLTIRCCGPKKFFAGVGLLMTAAIIFSTISRGPILGVVIALYVALTIHFRKLLAMSVTCGVLLMVILAAKPSYFEQMTIWFAKASGEREYTIVIGDEEQVRTSTMTRILLLQHYQKSLRHAGLIGYGMTATDTFPPNVPFVPFDEVRKKQFGIIDNTYVLLALRGGWLLSLAFAILIVTTAFQFHGLEKANSTLKVLCRTMIGVICAFALVVFTVYPDYAFMFVFLWTVGISSVNLVPEEQPSVAVAPKRRVRLP